MVGLASKVLKIIAATVLVAACTPKPASEPEAGFVVDSGPDDAQAVLDWTAKFAKDEGYMHLGESESLRVGAFHAHQFYRVDAQIIASTPFSDYELRVYFYRSGGPISKSTSDVVATADRYRTALQRSGLSVSVQPAE